MTNSEEEKYDLIERYVNRLLSSEEQAAFEKDMLLDPELKKDVEAYKEAQELILDQGILNVKLKLQEIHASEISKVKGKKYYLPGAAVLVIVSATLLYLYFTSPNQPAVTGTNTEIVSDSVSQSQTTAQNTDGNKTTAQNAVTKNDATPLNNNSTAVSQNQQQSNADNKIADTSSASAKIVTNPSVNTTTTQSDPDPVKVDPPKQGVDCAAKPVTGGVTTKQTCIDEASGNIIVNLGSLKGGAKPYKFALDKDDDFKTNSQFTDLAAGSYKVFVKDKNDCIYELEKVEVKSKICAPPETAFNPDIEPWKIPTFSGELRILNRANEKVYSTMVKNGSPESWYGTDNNGIALPSGLYLYMLIPDNGGEILKSHVTILR